MRAFACEVCGQLLFFDNTVCLRCKSSLGFAPSRLAVEALAPDDEEGWFRLVADPDGPRHRRCANQAAVGCSWLVEEGDGELCRSCRLTRTSPEAPGEDVADTEAAKRWLLFQLLDLGFDVPSRDDDPRRGLAFDLLRSGSSRVTIGHASGVVTIDVIESDDSHREHVRALLGEPYRTMLGHLRHEVAHYWWWRWSTGAEADPAMVEEARALFGDDRVDYQESINRHYREGAPEDWRKRYVSAYATMHPYEDWAETFAHVLHIRDCLQTAGSHGVVVLGPNVRTAPTSDLVAVPAEALVADRPFDEVVAEEWLPLVYALNAVNRSMGRSGLYPFVLAQAVLEKLAFVDRVIRARTSPAA